MAERTTVAESVQLGVETTPGILVAANKKLQSMGFDINPQIDTKKFRPSGSKYKTIVVPGKESSEANVVGSPTYDELVYAFSSVINTGTVATVAVTGRQWDFASAQSAPDTPKTFTIEHGSSVRAHRAGNFIISELGININRDELGLSGSAIALAIEDGITLTAAPTLIPLVPILPADVCVYMNDTFGTIGTTKLTRLLNAEWRLASRYGAFWPIDCALPSFGGTVEIEPELTLKLRVEADAAGMAFLTQVRAGAKKYVRIEATGDTIAGSSPSTPYSLRLDMPVEVDATDGFSDEDGLYAIEWNFIGISDSNIPGGVAARLVNTLAAL